MGRELTYAELDLVSGGRSRPSPCPSGTLPGTGCGVYTPDRDDSMFMHDTIFWMGLGDPWVTDAAVDPTQQPPDEDDDDEATTIIQGYLAASNGINIKEGADISDLTKEMTDIFDDISKAWADEAPGVTPVITSGSDGTHSTGSLHYDGNAVDLRTNNLTQAQTMAVASALSTLLGSGYDVVVEIDHIHVEYNPG
ncbi:MAG: hypothetical protein V3U57_08575 [Robiginitomaculum sp.]